MLESTGTRSGKSTEGIRYRCPKGHLIKRCHKTHCASCYNSITYHKKRAQGFSSSKASGHKYDEYDKKTKRMRYYLRRAQGMDSLTARGYLSTEARKNKLATEARLIKKYKKKWGRPGENPMDNYLRDIGKRFNLGNRDEVKAFLTFHGEAVLKADDQKSITDHDARNLWAIANALGIFDKQKLSDYLGSKRPRAD
ncbi:MAG: hypothetical protein ACRD5H_01900 [Nitrososphaerales archaeon]